MRSSRLPRPSLRLLVVVGDGTDGDLGQGSLALGIPLAMAEARVALRRGLASPATVSTWRDAASPRAQADLDRLLQVAVGFAQQQLAARGEFFPYASAIGVNGQPKMVAAMPAEGGDHPDSADVVAACFSALTQIREQLRAGAVVSDVRMASAADAIRVDLEHVEGVSIAVLLPYTKERGGQGIEYGQLQAGPGRRQIWT